MQDNDDMVGYSRLERERERERPLTAPITGCDSSGKIKPLSVNAYGEMLPMSIHIYLNTYTFTTAAVETRLNPLLNTTLNSSDLHPPQSFVTSNSIQFNSIRGEKKRLFINKLYDTEN